MRTFIKILCYFFLVAFVCVLAFIAYMGFKGGFDILDGPGMVYEWQENELYGQWLGVNGNTLTISKDECVLEDEDNTYHIPYDLVELSNANVKLKCKANNPYDYFLYIKQEDGIHVVCAFALDENEQYQILNEFVYEKDGIEAKGFVSEYKKMFDQSRFLSQTYTIDNALDCISYLGKTKSECNIENKYLEDVTSFYSINISSTLFDTPITGQMYSNIDPDLDIDSLVIDEVDLYAYDLSYDDIVARFQEMYTLKDSGEEPYAISSGGAVTWSEYDAGSASIRVTQGSESDFVMIQIKRK